MSQDNFTNRHIGADDADTAAMLKVIGAADVEELIAEVIPATIRLKKPLALPKEGMSEYEFSKHIRKLASRNKQFRSLIGMGYYGTATPAAIMRNVFENPAWYTSYTPYQAEISQGRLEALLNFQTAVISMTGMEVSNCSLLDEATATAEAMSMMYAQRSREAVKEGRNILFVDENIFPQTLDLLLTRSEPAGIDIVIDDFSIYEFKFVIICSLASSFLIKSDTVSAILSDAVEYLLLPLYNLYETCNSRYFMIILLEV